MSPTYGSIMLKLLLWLRYLRKRRIVFLSIAAVALSCALLIVVNSLFTGFIEALKQAERLEEGDLALVCNPIEKYDALIDKIEQIPQVKNAAVSLGGGGGMLWIGTGNVKGVAIAALDTKNTSWTGEFKDSLLRQKILAGPADFNVPDHPAETGAWVGIGIIAEPNRQTDEYDLPEIRKMIGQKAVLTLAGREPAPITDGTADSQLQLKRKVLSLRIADIYHSGFYVRDNALYLPYDKYYTLVYGDKKVQADLFRIKLHNGFEPDETKPLIRSVWEKFAAQLPGYSSEDIDSARIINVSAEGNLFFAELRKQMAVLMLIFGVICSVAILLIFCIFYMIVTTKQKDIAVIKSCGASSSSVALIFLGFGGCVGLLGSALGILLGYFVTKNINTVEHWVQIIFGWKLWRSSIYMFEQIPNTVDWGCVVWIVAAAILACIIGALIPAVTAARLKPVKILRYE